MKKDEPAQAESPQPHPGQLGYERGQGRFVFAIHANWPAYPRQNYLLAIYDLCQFPPNSSFSSIDEIDACILFVADTPHRPRPEALHPLNYHVAIWVEDLLELSDCGWISGISAVSKKEWETSRREDLRRSVIEAMGGASNSFSGDPLDPLFVRNPDGELLRLGLPPLPEEDMLDGEGPTLSHVSLPAQIMVTDIGRKYLAEQLSKNLELLEPLRRSKTLLELGLFDTAVREASVVLETAMRAKVGVSSSVYGQQLVTRLGQVVAAKYKNSAAKMINSQFRTTFKFIRNELAHNIAQLEELEARVLLFRINELLEITTDLD